METINTFQNNTALQNLIEQINNNHTPTLITTQKGDAVLLSKADWESIKETLYLQAISGFVESVRAAEQSNDWVSEDIFMQVLDGVGD